MSHYTCLIFGEDVAGQLAPYQENNMGDCPQEFMEFVEDEDSEFDEDEQKHGYWTNPNSKWDWYSVGGRWTGYFKVKPGVEDYGLGSPGVFGHQAEKGWADQCRKKDIDIEGIRNSAGEKAKNKYEMLERLLGEIPQLNYSWNDLISKASFKNLTVDSKRQLYHAQKGCKDLQKALEKEGLTEEEKSLLTWVDLDEYQCSKEEYIKRARDNALVTFAVIKDGEWFEKGQMGWWGCVSNERDEKEWLTEFTKLIDETPDEELMTLVDCHI